MKSKQKQHDNGIIMTVVAAVIIIAFALGGVWLYSLLRPKLSLTLSSNREIATNSGVEEYLAKKYSGMAFTIVEAEPSSYSSENCEGKLENLTNWKITDNHGVEFFASEAAVSEPSSLLGCVVSIEPFDNYQDALAIWVAGNSEGAIVASKSTLSIANEASLSDSELMKQILDEYVELRALGYSDAVLPAFRVTDAESGDSSIIYATDGMVTANEKIKNLRQ